MENDSKKKQHFLQHKNNKEAYTDRSKSTGSKVGFAAVLANITRGGALPEKASIHTAEMTTMREIQKREDIRWVIYTDLLTSILAIKNKNHPIINKIYAILAQLYN